VPDATAPTVVTVTAISAVHSRPAPPPGAGGRVPGPVRASAVLTPVASADGRTPDRDDLRFAGYLVQATA
jgi:hypothetical protein